VPESVEVVVRLQGLPHGVDSTRGDETHRPPTHPNTPRHTRNPKIDQSAALIRFDDAIGWLEVVVDYRGVQRVEVSDRVGDVLGVPLYAVGSLSESVGLEEMVDRLSLLEY